MKRKPFTPSLNHPVDPRPPAKSHALKRSIIRPVSPKRKSMLYQYECEKAKRGKGPHPCLVCGHSVIIGRNASWHHPSGRRTLETILDFAAVCEIPCHRDIHSNPSAALADGFLTPEFFRSTK